MKKLTAEKCRELIKQITGSKEIFGQVGIKEDYKLQALEIALPILEQQEQEQGEWIEWGGGSRPIKYLDNVEMRLRSGSFMYGYAGDWSWQHTGSVADIIAYRIIPERANKATLKDEMREWLIDECKADMQRYTSDSPRYLVAQIALSSLEDCRIIPGLVIENDGSAK